MKFQIYKTAIVQACTAMMMGALLLAVIPVNAQDEAAAAVEKKEAPKPKPVKNTFQSVWLIDNQTVLVPVKGTFEMDIMHRFGTVDKGYDDFWGFFAPSNIRLGVSYVPVNRLNVGIGVAKTTAAILPLVSKPQKVAGPAWDASLKYSIITQTKGVYPVSISYYTNFGFNTKQDPASEIYRDTSENGKSTKLLGISTDRFNYFHQLLIARKITDKLSVQVAPSLSHQNAVNGYFTQVDSATLKIEPEMKNTHFAVALMARYKLTKTTSVMVNYDQPITKHARNNPNPNLSFGIEFNTSSHSFQLFFTNYYFLTPQANNLYNSNSPFDYTNAEGTKVNGGKYLIGFNITRLWNY